ncbi:hypothetical protein CRYUN_Cryun29cG0012100 [Craigia yunnanensis]
MSSWEGQYDLDDGLTMPYNPEATRQAVIRLVSEMPKVDDATGSCSICIQSFSESDSESGAARRVSCGHVYHENCITNWLLSGRSSSCPMCRHDI